MNRLKKVAESTEFAQKLNSIPENEKMDLVEKELKILVTSDDIYDYAVKNNKDVADVDLDDLVSSLIVNDGLAQTIWESFQDSYDISEETNYVKLDQDIQSSIEDLIGSIDLDTLLRDAVQEAENQEEANSEEKDPWNQDDFI